MKKLSSFAEFSETKRINAAAALKEEQEIKRSGEANSFKSLLTEFGVSGIKELSEEQRSDFFNKLRNLGVNESNSLITEGTRSQVGVISKSGKITSTYVHSDGYPEHMLPMLNGYSESDIKQLMKLGKAGISFLDKSIGKKHSFSEPTKGYTIFYGRDRGESGDMRTTGQYRKVDQYLNDVANGTGAEWVYLWDEEHKNWLVADLYGDKELMPSSTFESVVTEYNYFGGNKISDDKLVRLIPKMPKGYVGKNTGIGKYTISTPDGEDIVLTQSKDKKNWSYEPSNVALKILNESYDYDEVAQSEFGMDYDQLGSGEKEWVRDEIDNMSMNESDSKYPSFEVDKNIRYQDTTVTKGYWIYSGKESGGRGVYKNVMNNQMLGFDMDDLNYFKKHLPDHFNISENRIYELVNEAVKKKKGKNANKPIGKPMRDTAGGKAYKVYVKDPKTKKVKTVRFGSGGLRAKINDSKARAAFAARHKCSSKKDRTKAGYWSCRLPRYAKLLGLKSSFSGFW